jgi:hypothetical protein
MPLTRSARDDSCVSVPIVCELGNLTVADAMMIAIGSGGVNRVYSQVKPLPLLYPHSMNWSVKDVMLQSSRGAGDSNCEFPNYLAPFFPRYLAYQVVAAHFWRRMPRSTVAVRQISRKITRHLSWKITVCPSTKNHQAKWGRYFLLHCNI